MRKGEISGTELEEESAEYMTSIGLIYNEVLGWIKPGELEQAGIKDNAKVVPTFIEVTAKGKKQRINYKFREFMEDQRLEDYFRRENRADLESMVDNAAQSLKGIEDAPF